MKTKNQLFIFAALVNTPVKIFLSSSKSFLLSTYASKLLPLVATASGVMLLCLELINQQAQFMLPVKAIIGTVLIFVGILLTKSELLEELLTVIREKMKLIEREEDRLNSELRDLKNRSKELTILKREKMKERKELEATEKNLRGLGSEVDNGYAKVVDCNSMKIELGKRSLGSLTQVRNYSQEAKAKAKASFSAIYESWKVQTRNLPHALISESEVELLRA